MIKEVPPIPVATRGPGAKRRKTGFNTVSLGAEYSQDELDFMKAVDRYKRESGRAFPTLSEILKVFVSLGYRKVETQ